MTQVTEKKIATETTPLSESGVSNYDIANRYATFMYITTDVYIYPRFRNGKQSHGLYCLVLNIF